MDIDCVAKIPALKTGTDFLSSSHFHIGNEPLWLVNQNPAAYRSTFKSDYLPRLRQKAGLVSIPPPADMMHKDNRILDQCSVTRKEFIPKQICDGNYSRNSLTKTNFKMDRDYRIETFQTTQEACYPAKLICRKTEISSKPMASHIPQGDKEKESWPDSSYRTSFQGKVGETKRFVKTNNFLNVSANTIQGDTRSHGCDDMFNTSSRLVFPVHKGGVKIIVADSIKYPKTILPCGEKLPLESTHQEAFKAKLLSQPFNRNKALDTLQKTTFKNGDNRMDCFQTTADDCYTFKTAQRRAIPGMSTCMFKSSIPEGDRSLDQINSSVNKTDYKAPSRTYRHIVDGSELNAVSNISFGNDRRSYYETTIDSSFPFKYGRYCKATADTCHSSIPLNVYGKLTSNSSYRIDYLSTKGLKKLVPNPAAVDNLNKSHIGDPIRNFREFKTTHGDTYTSKEQTRVINIDAGRLQKSSLPIGTLCQ